MRIVLKKPILKKTFENHPDRNNDKESVIDNMKRINLAYEFLTKGSNNIPQQSEDQGNDGDPYAEFKTVFDRYEREKKDPEFRKISKFLKNHMCKKVLEIPITNNISLYLINDSSNVSFGITYNKIPKKKYITINSLLVFGFNQNEYNISEEQRMAAEEGNDNAYNGLFGKFKLKNGEIHFKDSHPKLYDELSKLRGQFGIEARYAFQIMDKIKDFKAFMNNQYEKEYLSLLFGNNLPPNKQSKEEFVADTEEYANQIFERLSESDKAELKKIKASGPFELNDMAYIESDSMIIEMTQNFSKIDDSHKDLFKETFMRVIKERFDNG